ncbi:hypothetical protein C8F01DRAFT_1307613 [Mycena amicta]|nr:hypothetical protein C8F01DRAFT_1307613 [Mycena amicta]
MPNHLLLSASQREAVISLGNVVGDSVHQDISARDAFLVDSAQEIMRYLPQAQSFIESKAIGDSLFAIRNEMVCNSFRTSGPFGRVYSDILSFCAAINTGRRVQRERQRGADERKHDAEAAANRRERLEALEYASRLAEWQANPLPPCATPSSERSISLSDGDGHTVVEESASPEYSPPSPIGPDMAMNNSPGLSPIEGMTVPMTPPSSPHPSLPELISASNSSESTSSERSPSPPSRAPIVFRRSSENQRSVRARRTLPPPGQRIGYQREFPRTPRRATPIPMEPRFVLLPRMRPVAFPSSQNTNFADDSRALMQHFIASPANASASSGNFKPLLPKKTRRGRRGQGRKIKAAIAQAMAAEEHRRLLEENRTRYTIPFPAYFSPDVCSAWLIPAISAANGATLSDGAPTWQSSTEPYTPLALRFLNTGPNLLDFS